MAKVTIQQTRHSSFADVVKMVLRKGYYLRLNSNGQIEVCGWRECPPHEDIDALDVWYNDLKRRLKRPRGWPKCVRLPDWWSDVALGFKVLRAQQKDCPECSYPVGVLIDFEDWVELRCPRCGISLDPVPPDDVPF